MKKILYSLSALLIFILSENNLSAQVNVSPTNSGGCAPFNGTYTCTAPGATYYVWFFNDGPGSGFITNNVYSHTFGPRNGPYFCDVKAYNSSFVYLGTANFFVNVNGADDSLFISNTNMCPGDITDLTLNQTLNQTNVNWDFGDGSFLNNVPYFGVEHRYNTVGTYYPKAIVTTGCGIDTVVGVINVSTSGTFPTNLYTYVPVDSVCPGDPFTISPNFMYANFVINWGDGNFSTNVSSHQYSTIGTYQVQITYINGCSNTLTQSFTVFVGNNLPVPFAPAIDIMPDSACINTTVSFYPYPPVYSTYSWNFGLNDTALTEVATRQFTSIGDKPVTLTATNGCGNSITAYDTARIVNSIPVPAVTLQIFPPTICTGDAVFAKADVSNGGEDNYTFSWNYGDGNYGAGKETTHTYSTNGTYAVTLTVSNICGNTANYSGSVTVTNNVQPDSNYYMYGVPPFTSSGVTGCIGDSLVFIFVAQSPLDSITWDFGDLTSGVATTEVTVNGGSYRIIKHAYTAFGTYSPKVTFKNACGNSFTAYAPYNVLIGGNYSIQESKIFFDETAYHCQGKDVAFYSFGGSTYIWNFGDGTGDLISYNTLSPVNHAFQQAGQYTVTCKAINNCGYTNGDTVSITIPPSKIEITTNTVSSNCGINDGTAIAIGSGGTTPYIYQWSNGNSTFLADSLISGIYVITITDIHGCSNFAIATVSDQQAPALAVSTVIDVSCFGGNNGAIDITPIGSTAPYTYLWSNGQTTQDVNQLVSGPYEVEVTDVNGCKATKSITVAEPPEVILSTLSTSASCGNNDGSAGVAVSGITGPYSFIWSNGGSTQIIYGIGAGVYTVTVVDNNGCIYQKSVAVNNQNAPIIIVDSITGTGCSNSLANVYVRTVNGTSPFAYSWSNGATTLNLINVSVGNYTLKVTDANGCKSFKQVSISKDPPTGTAICIVTVDTITGFNVVVFNKDTLTTGVAGFNIYKESTLSGLYYFVAFVDFDSANVWIDSLSDSRVRSWRYKVAVVDNCNNESELSGEHKTIHLNVNAGINNSYNLIWDQYEGFSFGTYNIYRYSQSNGWQFLGSVPNNLISYTDLTPPVNTIAYMVDAVPTITCNDNLMRYSNETGILAAINTSHSNIKNLLNVPGGENEINIATDFSIYPNPTSGNLNMVYPFSEKGYAVNVYNALGQIVYEVNASSGDSQMLMNQKTVDLSKLAKGIYTISFSNQKGTIYKKLILQ